LKALHNLGTKKSFSSRHAIPGRYEAIKSLLRRLQKTHRKNPRKTRDIDVDKLLEVPDDAGVKVPGIFMYTKDVPTVLLQNISTPLGLVNRAQGKVLGIVPDPNGY
jgi:hypothetical protein